MRIYVSGRKILEIQIIIFFLHEFIIWEKNHYRGTKLVSTAQKTANFQGMWTISHYFICISWSKKYKFPFKWQNFVGMSFPNSPFFQAMLVSARSIYTWKTKSKPVEKQKLWKIQDHLRSPYPNAPKELQRGDRICTKSDYIIEGGSYGHVITAWVATPVACHRFTVHWGASENPIFWPLSFRVYKWKGRVR